MLSSIWIAGWGGGLACAAAPQPGGPEIAALDLPTALALAAQHSPSLRIAELRVEAAAGRAEQARVWPNPQLELSGEEIPLEHGEPGDGKYTIGLAQTVPFPGKKSLDRRMGSLGVRVGEAELAYRRAELERDVKIAFFKALAVEHKAGLLRDLVEVADENAAAARKRVEAGAAPLQEQLRAEAQSVRARAELLDLERERVAARQELVRTLGRPDLADVPIRGDLARHHEPPQPAGDFGAWIDRQPRVRAALNARDQSQLALRRARIEPYPDVEFSLAAGRSGIDDAAIVEVRASVPLPILDRSRGRRMEAAAQAGIADSDVVAARHEVMAAWTAATARLRTANEQVAAYRDDILPKTEDALRLVRSAFEEGKIGLIDLLDTQRSLAEAQLAYQRSLLELNLAHAEVEFFLNAAATTPTAPHSTTFPEP